MCRFLFSSTVLCLVCANVMLLCYDSILSFIAINEVFTIYMDVSVMCQK